MRKLFVIFPLFSKVEIKKSPGVIPESLIKLGYQTFIFCKNPPKNTGLKTKVLKLSFKNILRYLRRERDIKQTLLFYFIPYNIKFVLFFLFAKLYNPRTSIVIKTDGLPNYEEWSFWRKFVRGIEAKLLYPLLVDRIITEAPEYKDYLPRMFGWKGLRDKIVVLPNGVELKDFNLKKKKKNYKSVFYAGTLSVPKGTHILLEAFTKLSDSYSSWKLVLAGNPDPGFKRELQCYKSKLGGQLELKGFLTGRELHQEFVDADIYVFPSYTWKEGFNLALLEAMASENAIIATDKKMEGINYALDYGKAGLLFRKEDVDHLAQLLSSLMGNKNLREKMATSARQRAEEIFDLEKIIERWSLLMNAYAT